MLEWTQVIVDGGVRLHLAATPAGIRSVWFGDPPTLEGGRNAGNALLLDAGRQLRDYFAGELREFHLPLDMVGSPFQKRVWNQLLAIPYGETRSYGQIAAALGDPNSVRAVGAANGANPIPIIVPCHRVIGASGKLVGYGGGLELKKRLLELESRAAPPGLF